LELESIVLDAIEDTFFSAEEHDAQRAANRALMVELTTPKAHDENLGCIRTPTMVQFQSETEVIDIDHTPRSRQEQMQQWADAFTPSPTPPTRSDPMTLLPGTLRPDKPAQKPVQTAVNPANPVADAVAPGKAKPKPKTDAQAQPSTTVTDQTVLNNLISNFMFKLDGYAENQAKLTRLLLDRTKEKDDDDDRVHVPDVINVDMRKPAEKKAKPKKTRVKVYAVSNGRKTGVFFNWSQVCQSVSGFSGATYKKFHNEENAWK
jgi:hypothetical protein